MKSTGGKFRVNTGNTTLPNMLSVSGILFWKATEPSSMPASSELHSFMSIYDVCC